MNSNQLETIDATAVNKYLKLHVVIEYNTNFTLLVHNLFMTIGQSVMSAEAVSESLLEGKTDYCMIVCE